MVNAQPSGFEGTRGWVSLVPAVAGVAAAERDVLHLEEVAAVLELEQRWQERATLEQPRATPATPAGRASV